MAAEASACEVLLRGVLRDALLARAPVPPTGADASAWSGLAALAEKQAVASLVAAHLADRDDGVPARVSEWARDRRRESSARALVLDAALGEVGAALAAAGVRAATFKGPALARQALGDTALRDSFDLDLLLGRSDVDAALRALDAIGFRGGGPRDRSDNALPLVRDAVHLDLHWCAAPAYARLPLSVEEVLENARVEATPGLLTPTDEDHFLLVCMHGHKSLWRRLGWVVDAAALLLNGRLSAAAVAQRARAGGMGRLVAVASILAERLTADGSGADLARLLGAGRLEERLAVRIETRARAIRVEDDEPWSRLRLQLSSRERLGDRMQHLVRLAYTPPPATRDVEARVPPARFVLGTARLLRSALRMSFGC